MLALAAALRLWGLVMGSPAWHADEHYLVYVPLKFFSGDLNPGQDLVAVLPRLALLLARRPYTACCC